MAFVERHQASLHVAILEVQSTTMVTKQCHDILIVNLQLKYWLGLKLALYYKALNNENHKLPLRYENWPGIGTLPLVIMVIWSFLSKNYY